MRILKNGRWLVNRVSAAVLILFTTTTALSAAPPCPPLGSPSPPRILRLRWEANPHARFAHSAKPLHWTPASFRGVILGRSTVEDAQRLFGQPDAREPSHSMSSQVKQELIYRRRGDHHGDVAVRLDASGVIVEVQESFPVAIPRSRIYKELGPNAVTAHYSIARCAAGELYRDASGVIELTLYPERGIVLWPDQYGYDFAAILYLARAPGAPRPPACVSKR